MNFYLILKKVQHILLNLMVLAISMSAITAFAQVPGDTTFINPVDSSIVLTDTSTTADSISLQTQKSDIETTIKYTARDSIRLDVIKNIVYLYGDAKIDYGDITLTAEKIEINWGSNVLTAMGAVDSMGKKLGTPVFKEAADQYEADTIRYNFKSKKGIISGIVTQQGEGYIHGEKVKKVGEDMYIRDAHYTTCNLEHPHFYIAAPKIKVIPNDKLVSGPFNLYVADIPTPLGFILGMFPVPKKQKSGIIFPMYGESADRGFFLRNGGYYWALSDYVGIKFLGEIYSRGSYGGQTLTQYIKRYRYQGNLDLKYNHLVLFPNGEKQSSEQFWVTWNHNSNNRGSTSFTSSVSFGSTNYNRFNSYSPGAYLSNQFNSTVSFYKTFTNTPFYLGITGRHDQNVVGETSIVNLNLPDVNFGMNRIYPFKRKVGGGKKWYEQINLTYTLNSRYLISNAPRSGETDTIPFSFANANRLLRERGQFGTRHAIPLTTSIKLLKYFSLNPSVNYEEIWYLKQLQHTLNTSTNQIEVDTTSGFYRVYSFGAGTSLTTQVYGTYRFRSKVMPAIRHTLIPSLSYNYRPDFSRAPFNYYNRIIDTAGQEQVISKYNGFIFGTPGSGRSNLLGFSFQNTLEAKVRDRKDTTNETGIKKIKLIERLGVIGNYNFTADSLHLSQITLNANTRLFNRFDINFTSTFDPYALRVDSNGIATRIGRFAIDEGQGIARLVNYSLSFSTSLNPKQRSKIYNSPNATEEELRYINRHPELYVDFNIPWNLNIMYNLSYNRVGLDDKNVIQTLSFNGDVKLTDKWKVGFSSGWDFVQKSINQFTSFNIYRDLHCWEMRLSVIPFGFRQSYTFDINVKASVLQDLKLNRKRDWYDNSLR